MTVPSSTRCSGPAEAIGPVDAGRVAVAIDPVDALVLEASSGALPGAGAPAGGAYFVVARTTASATSSRLGAAGTPSPRVGVASAADRR
jgi:hypothetical protein